jgi:hypothetical protein
MRVLAFSCIAVLLCPAGALAQAKVSSYTVKQGESVLSIADAIRGPKATANQMGIALVRANPKVFQSREDNRLPAGSNLSVPDDAVVLKTSPAAAEREFSRYWRGEQHYRAGLALEKSKDMFYAFTSYTEGAKLGHGPCQARLGELYDNDLSGFVRHDLQESMRWYERARDNQVEIRNQRGRGPQPGSTVN